MHLVFVLDCVDADGLADFWAGATLIQEPHDDNASLIAVLADPEGNEFCAIVNPHDRPL
jgi:predicted enzyme related to lactoylglutathione lyase